MTSVVVITVFALTVGAFAVATGYSGGSKTLMVFGGVAIMIVACLFSALAGNLVGTGCIEEAGIKLSPGETYECIAGPSQDSGIYYSVVKTCNGEIYGLEFKELPPQKGVVSRKGDQIVFFPIIAQSESKGVTIKNPLAETPKTAQ